MFSCIKTASQWQRILFLYILCLIGIVILADTGLLPVRYLIVVPHYDLWGHFFLYGILSSLLKRSLPPRLTALSLIIPIVCATAEEISQKLFASRTFSLLDLSFGILGILLFSLAEFFPKQFLKFLTGKKRPSSQSPVPITGKSERRVIKYGDK